MFESIEIRRAANGFILVITTEEETREYVYDTSRKAIRVIKEMLENDRNKVKEYSHGSRNLQSHRRF